MVCLVHHQQFEPARAVLHVHFDAELMARAPFGEFALQFAAQTEGRARTGLADEEDGARAIADLVDAELTGQAGDLFVRQRPPRLGEA